MDARIWKLSIPKIWLGLSSKMVTVVGGKHKPVINWALNSQIDWIQLCKFNDRESFLLSVPAFFTLGAFDRATQQNLYLKPPSSSPLKLSFPKGFDIAWTPLVTFCRIDLVLSKDELISIHKPSQLNNVVTLDDTTSSATTSFWLHL